MFGDKDLPFSLKQYDRVLTLLPFPDRAVFASVQGVLLFSNATVKVKSSAAFRLVPKQNLDEIGGQLAAIRLVLAIRDQCLYLQPYLYIMCSHVLLLALKCAYLFRYYSEA